MELRKIISLVCMLTVLVLSVQAQDSSGTLLPAKKDTAPKEITNETERALFRKSDSLINASKKLFSNQDTAVAETIAPVPPVKNNSSAIPLATTATDSHAVSPKPKPFHYQPLVKDSLNYSRFLEALLTNNLFFKTQRPAIQDIDKPHYTENQDWLFYIIAVIFSLLAFIRLGYRKYFGDLFLAFYNPTLSQRQLKEQLSQTPFPAFLLNIFFAIVTGTYLFLILRYFHYIVNYNPYILIGVFILLFSIIYLLKFLFLRLSGWLFGDREMVNSYIFIIYLVNKILAVCLLPFLLMLAFSSPRISMLALYASVILIVLLFGFRYIRAYGLIKNYINFNKLHFFLYLCAFELIPLLVIAKMLLIWLNGNA